MLKRHVLFGFISNNFEINKNNKLVKFLRNIKNKIINLGSEITIFKKEDKNVIFRKLVFINKIEDL